MIYTYTVARFDPDASDPQLPIQTRNVSGESEDQVINMIGPTDDGSYWEVIDTNDPNLTRILR